LLETVADYFKTGLAANEFCVWAVSEPASEQNAKHSLRATIPDFDRHLAAGAMELISGRDWYLPGEELDIQRITGGWAEKMRSALARGFNGLRVSGNAF